ncbi:hypothetical protein ACP70R_008509 [Stipagrostis hirtigluma subsp. patula]
MAIPAGAPFCKYIDDSILTPLISRLDFMLTEDHFGAPEPADSAHNEEVFNRITGKLCSLQQHFSRIREEEQELALIRCFDHVEKYIDNIFESIAAGERQPGDIQRRLHTLKKHVADVRGAILKPYAPEESAGGGGDAQAPTIATDHVPAVIRDDGEEMAHLRRSVSVMDEPLKSCLLSLAAFPEGARIKTRLLIHWWIGEGLVADAEEGKQRFDRLLQMKFVRAIHRQHCETAHCCYVHPWIHRVIVAVANSSAFMEVDPDGDSSDDYRRTRRACLRNGKATIPGSGPLFHPKVSTIYNIDQKYVKLSAEWFPNKSCLRTLQLGQWRVFDGSERAAAAEKFHVELIHDEHLRGIGACRKLRYLSLRGISRIKAIPDAVGNLSELIVLDLRACHNLQALTKGITKLRKLQYLDVSECYLLVEMPQGLGKISKLQVLKGFVVASSVRKNACHLSELVKLENLLKLSICIGKKVMKERQDELNKLATLHNLKSLRITWAVMTSKEGDDTQTLNTAGTKFSLPPGLVKLDLQCFPYKEFGHFISNFSTQQGASLQLQKLYVTGGALESLQTLFVGENLNLKVLRLRFLKNLKDDDWEELRAKYTGLEIVTT